MKRLLPWIYNPMIVAGLALILLVNLKLTIGILLIVLGSYLEACGDKGPERD